MGSGGQHTTGHNVGRNHSLNANCIPVGLVKAQLRGVDKGDGKLRGIVADVFIDEGGGVDIALRVGLVRPVERVGVPPGILMRYRVPELVASGLDEVPAKPPIVHLTVYWKMQ